MRILVMGGHGHLAGEFIRVFGSTHEITATIRENRVTTETNAHFVVATTPSELAELLHDGRFDAVVHLAQVKRFAADVAGDLERFREEFALCSRILEHAVRGGIDRVFVASTGGLYADNPSPLTETDRLLEPPNLDSYFASKLAMEAMLSPLFGALNVTIGRFFFIYGPKQDSTRLMRRLIDSVRSGRPVGVSRSGGVRMNPIYVEDAARSIERCLLHNGGRIVNIAGPETTTIRDLTERIGTKLGIEPVFELGALDRNLVADTSVLMSLSDTSFLGLDEGLERTMSEELS